MRTYPRSSLYTSSLLQRPRGALALLTLLLLSTGAVLAATKVLDDYASDRMASSYSYHELATPAQNAPVVSGGTLHPNDG